MKGHIRQRSKGLWSIVIDMGKNPKTGKRQQQWQTVKGTKKDAERILRELLYSLETGSYVKSSKLSVGQFLEEWLRDYVLVKLLTKNESKLRNDNTPSPHSRVGQHTFETA